jgi:hypothetical protein
MPFNRKIDADRSNRRRTIVGGREGQKSQNDLLALRRSPHLDKKRRRPRPLTARRTYKEGRLPSCRVKHDGWETVTP